MSNELNILISNITSFDFQKFNSGVFYLTLSHRKIDLLLSMMMPHARLVSGLWTNQRPVCTWLSCSIRQDTTCHPPPGSASVPLKEKIVGCYVKNILVFCCHLPFSSTGSARQSIMTWVCLSKESRQRRICDSFTAFLLSLSITFLQEYFFISCLQDLIKPTSAAKSCAIIFCLLVSCSWH